MTWLVKDYDDQYLTESADGCAYFSEKQRDAKRFEDQGRAYRVCMRWGCDKVVRLVTRAPVLSDRLNPGARVRLRTAPTSAGVVDGWIGPSHVRVAWDAGHRTEVVASSLELEPKSAPTESNSDPKGTP